MGEMMTRQINILHCACFVSLWLFSSIAASQVELDDMTVEGANEESTSEETDKLDKSAANSTLGSFLDDMPNVDSASYGEAVGRPVVRGMSGYRIKILQNDNEVSDLSAMSQDHAVAVAPHASERIELLKGPMSLLYAAQAGGVIRISDALDAPFNTPGFSGELSGDYRPEPVSHSIDAHISNAGEKWAFNLGALEQQSDPYKDGRGRTIPDSDVETQQGQLGVGWRPNERSELQLNATLLSKDYGIPNETVEATRIDMQREDIGAKYIYQPAPLWLDEIRVDLLHSDYLHDETEGDSRDGLFGQVQQHGALVASWAKGAWFGESRLSFTQSELKVCHEHGACEDFETATRTGNEPGESVLQHLEEYGLPYSHGHPIPNTRSQSWQLSTTAETAISPLREIRFGANIQARDLNADPSNIQEQWVYPASLDPEYYNDQSDVAISVSAGLHRHIQGLSPGWEVSLSYLERLPSVDELFWNGFHHATDSYIFGNPDLRKESSVNLDFDLIEEFGPHRLQFSAFYYYFNNYIYQDRAYEENGDLQRDPFHLSQVWFTRQTDAVFYGGSLRYESQLAEFTQLPLTFWLQGDVLDAKESNGERLPRTAPANTETGLQFEAQSWLARMSWKHVFNSRLLAPNESATEGYDWLSFFVQKQWQLGDNELDLWLKGENLLDSFAQNHLSVLKETAPLPGRQVSMGIGWSF